MVRDTTTIQIMYETKELLDLKKKRGDSYDDIIRRLLKVREN